MFEKQVTQTIQILHCYVGGCNDVRLLVRGVQSDGDIGFFAGVFVCLVRDDTDNVAKLAV